MSNSKISALTSATTPLAGTEVLPVVQSSTTKQVSVANLTAGRAVSVKNITASDLTSGRVAYVGTSGLIQDSANFQFNGNDAAVGRTPSTFNTAYKGLQVGGSGGNDIVLVGGDASLGTGYYLSGLGAYAYSQTGSTVGTINLYNKQMIFKVAAAGTAGNAISWTQIGGFTTAGDFEMTTGNLIPATAAKGINFTANTPAAGMTSQLLNWYEEGATTVTLAFGGASTGITYSTQQCRYTRIGNRVLIQIGLALSSKGSATGAATITGLPFTSKNVGYGGAMMTVYADNMAGVTGAICPFLPENSSTIQLKKVDVAGNANVTVANTDFNNTSYLMISGQYLVA